MAILNPKPGSPKRLSFGMVQSSNMRLHVDDARMPSLSSFLPNDKPAEQQATC